jgi:hypothetical protein
MRTPALETSQGSFSKVLAVSNSPNHEVAKGYREEAKRVRERAAITQAPDIREALEKIARQYEAMAESIERRVTPFN